MLEEKFWSNGVVSDLLKEISGQRASNIYCGAKHGLFEGQCEQMSIKEHIEKIIEMFL